MKKIYKFLFFLFFLIIASAFFAEIYLKNKFVELNKRDIDIWRAIVYSDSVHRKENSKFAFRLYGLNSEVLLSAEIKLNNLGLISTYDYKKFKDPKEFRIAVMGGEQSASSTSNFSWPDKLYELLNEKYPKQKFSVYNFAWPDAGPEHYIQYWKDEVSSYQPDLVIINYPETDFLRTIQGAKLSYRGKDLDFGKTIKILIDDHVYTTSAAVTSDNTGVIDIQNPNVIVSRPYGFIAKESKSPISATFDSDAVYKLQKKIVNDQIIGASPRFGYFLTSYLFDKKSQGLRVSKIRNFDYIQQAASNEADIVDFGLKNFGWLKKNIPNVILTHTFHVYEMDKEFRYTNLMMEKDPSIKVEDMRNYIPKDLNTEDLKGWFHVPHMSEKFNDKGHLEYAKMIALMICKKNLLPVKECAR